MSESEYDALRRAFDDLAGTPPLVLGRRGAVMQQIQARQRRTAVARSAMSAVFLLMVSVSAAKVIQSRPSSDSTLQVDPSPAVSAEPSPSPSKSRAPDKPVAKPAPKPAPSKTTAKPAPPPVEKPVYVKGDPLTTWVWTDPAKAVVGQQVVVTAKAYDGAGRVLRVALDFGDGSSKVFEPDSSCAEQGTKVRYPVGHAWAKAGTYLVRAKFTTGGCGAATEYGAAAAEIHVYVSEPTTKPAAYDNGPAVPAGGGEQYTGEKPDYVYVTLTGSDTDGFVRKIYVDWGDGTTEIAGEWGTDTCQNASGTDHPKPTSRQAWSKHQYATSGPHTVTVTVKSVACDGSDLQIGTKSFGVTQP